MAPAPSPWWAPERHRDRRPALLARNAIQNALRTWFAKEGFIEAACGQLAVSPGNEAHLHAFATEEIGTDAARRTLYLHTSPEFAAKKLLAAGETQIFDFARVFRNRERGPLHAPEFTMLEWYRANAPYEAIMADTGAVVRIAAETAGARAFHWRGKTCDPTAQAERLSVSEAFARFADIDLGATLDEAGNGLSDALAAAAAKAGVAIGSNETWTDVFSRILVERVEPHLGLERPCLLDRYPRCEAALARACTDDPRFAERFELYMCGVELANGFGELTDPVEQRQRFEAEMAEKHRVYGERYPIDEDLLSALAHMPPASGVALGFDRLVMLATGAPSIDTVLWTPAP
ncbi:MAG TPA: EF-P lysine aminoacylase GenX [Alphaproteobacteria bacterium]|nr:EF-P lysine aminoacylase GenX [Alphaproteobacteria bacterium]